MLAERLQSRHSAAPDLRVRGPCRPEPSRFVRVEPVGSRADAASAAVRLVTPSLVSAVFARCRGAGSWPSSNKTPACEQGTSRPGCIKCYEIKPLG